MPACDLATAIDSQTEKVDRAIELVGQMIDAVEL